MGNSNEIGKNEILGRMFISLESNTVKSGEILRGSIHMFLREELVSPTLYLIFKGNESILCSHTVYVSEEVSKTVTYTRKNSIYSLKIKLYQWTDPVSSGNYTFPFELKIDDNLYPIFMSDLERHNEIKYTLSTQLHISKKPPLKFKLPIYVFASIITSPLDMYPNSLEKKCLGYGNTCFCWNEEYASARVWIDKAIFSRSDTMDIHIEANLSKFSADIQRIKIEVYKILSIKTDDVDSLSLRTRKFSLFQINENHVFKKGLENQIFNYSISVQSILKDDLCYSISLNFIKCHYVINVKFLTENLPGKFYKFEEASQSFVILPSFMQYPLLPLEPLPMVFSYWPAQVFPQSYFNADGSQNLDNPNTQIVSPETVLNEESVKLTN